MKKKLAFGVLSITGGVLLSVNAFGQVGDEGFFSPPEFQFSPQFFMAVIAGVLLALGFQAVLTSLSVAAGVTAIGNIRKKAHKSEKSDGSSKSNSSSDSDGSSTPAGVKFMSAAGVWNMLTAAISVFFASLLAVKLSLVPDDIIGLILGLVIWAVFFMTLMYLESKAIRSIIGGTFSAAVKAVKAGASAVGTGASAVGSGVGAVFSKSPSKKFQKVADNTVDKIGGDLEGYVAGLQLDKKLDKYFNKLQPRELNLDDVKDELAELINEIQVEEKPGEGPGEKELFLKVAEKQPKFSKKDISTLSKYYDMAKAALKVSGAVGGVGGAAKILSKTPPVQKIKHDVEDYLKRTGEPELHPEVLKAELDEIFKNPSSVAEVVKNKAKAIDKETIVTAVAAKQGVSREQALKIANKVEEAIDQVRENVASNIEAVENKAREAKDKAVGAVKDKRNEITHNIEDKIKAFFEKVDRPEMNYERLKLDFEIMLKNPKVAPKILKAKLKESNVETLVALLAANDSISQEDAENIVAKYEDAKANVMVKLDQAENGVKNTMDDSKEFALKQAENTRKTAVAASWWLFATLVISGAAAAVGGMLAL